MSLSLKKVSIIIALFVFVVSFSFFFYVPAFFEQIDSVFISITIFLFAILVGFFVSRQSGRYNQIISKVTDFDGNMSFLYRASHVFGKDVQNVFAQIMINHYSQILQSGDWDSYFSQKTSTLTDLHNVLNIIAQDTSLNPAQSAFISRAYFGLGEMQKIRKNLIALYKESIPAFQWFLFAVLVLILVLAVSTFDSEGILFLSFIKASFVTAIVVVILMLYRLNRLQFYEEMVGKSSAQDVLNIIQGNK